MKRALGSNVLSVDTYGKNILISFSSNFIYATIRWCGGNGEFMKSLSMIAVKHTLTYFGFMYGILWLQLKIPWESQERPVAWTRWDWVSLRPTCRLRYLGLAQAYPNIMKRSRQLFSLWIERFHFLAFPSLGLFQYGLLHFGQITGSSSPYFRGNQIWLHLSHL